MAESANSQFSYDFCSKVLLLLSKTAEATADQKTKLGNLRIVQEIITNRLPALRSRFFEKIMQFRNDSIPGVRVFVLEFVEETWYAVDF